jgi:hypothetical protein
MQTNIHALSGIRTQGPSVLVGEDISCLRPRGHCDQLYVITLKIFSKPYKLWRTALCNNLQKHVLIYIRLISLDFFASTPIICHCSYLSVKHEVPHTYERSSRRSDSWEASSWIILRKSTNTVTVRNFEFISRKFNVHRICTSLSSHNVQARSNRCIQIMTTRDDEIGSLILN